LAEALAAIAEHKANKRHDVRPLRVDREKLHLPSGDRNRDGAPSAQALPHN
jgi:hypothetical protein